MKSRLFAFTSCAMLLLWLAGCNEPRNDQPLSYDPPGSTITTDKPITPQEIGTFGFADPGIWVSNQFEGARMSGFEQIDAAHYRVVIRPENHPINNSAWYAFKIWSGQPLPVALTLAYEHGDHRYHPKISRDGRKWTPLDDRFYAHDTTNKVATLQLQVSPDTLWVSAQELITSRVFAAWMDSLTALPYVRKVRLGASRQGRPLDKLEISSTPAPRGVVLVISRQHPPEVTGSFACMAFVETLCSDMELAKKFRQHFLVAAVPLVNPDGVGNGHWRHNAGGVDLNRDWLNFNQPETRQIRDDFLRYKNDTSRPVYFGIDFHSTQEDVFYTVSKNVKTFPDKLSDRWLEKIAAMLPDYHVNEEPGGTESPTSKSWFHREFGLDAVTYEVGDESDRQQIRRIARAAAIALMQLLLEQTGA